MLSQSVVLCILPLQELEKLKWEKQRDERMRQQIKENRWTMVISSMKKIANWTLRILPPPTHMHTHAHTHILHVHTLCIHTRGHTFPKTTPK